MEMQCAVGRCDQGAVTELRLQYLHDDGDSRPVWEPLCGQHAATASLGSLPVLSLSRPVRYLAQRPLEDHEHDYRIMSSVPVNFGGAITGHTEMRSCRCGDRTAA
jgi:hypothetical protein